MKGLNELIEQYYSKNEYKREYRDYTIFVDYEKATIYKNDVKNDFAYKPPCNPSISYNLAKDLLKPQYIPKLTNFFVGNYPYLTLIGLHEKDNMVCESINIILYKNDLLDALSEGLNINLITLNNEEQEIYNNLIKLCDINKLLKDYENKYYTTTIENEIYSIPVNSFFNKLLLLSDKDFDDFFNDEGQTIEQMPKKYFLYMLASFFRESKIITKYFLPQLKNRLKLISNYERIDFQAVNRIPISDLDYLKGVHVNEELELAVLKDINPNFNPLEKAIFIYIKLCKILEYDEIFYLHNNRFFSNFNLIKHHYNKNYIAKITPENNNSICWEFNAIFAYFIFNLNLLFEIVSSGPKEYAESHNHICFIWDKFIIQADSTQAFDMQFARLNQDLYGLVCLNLNRKTQKEFDLYYENVYNYIITLEKQKNTLPKSNIFGTTFYKENYDMIISEYQKIYEIDNIELKYKINIFFNKIKNSGLSRMDALMYGIAIKSILFTTKETCNYVRYTILMHQQKVDDKIIQEACAVLTFNKDGKINDISDNIHYLYIDNEWILITAEELSDYFENNNLKHISKSKVPGFIY